MRTRIFAVAVLVAALPLGGGAQSEPQTRRILVTQATPGQPLTSAELDLRVNRKPVEILRLYQPEEAPLRLALLIAEDAGGTLAQNLREVQRFLEGLPEGSQIQIAYLQAGTVRVVQPFTSDRAAASAALRLPEGGQGPSDVAQLVGEALEQFPETARERPQILYLGEGSEPTPGLYEDFRLNRTIAAAQQRGAAIWAIHVGSELTHRPGEPYLDRLCRETGGRALALGTHPPSLEPDLKELAGLLARQFLVEFEAANGRMNKLEVKVNKGRQKLLYPTR